MHRDKREKSYLTPQEVAGLLMVSPITVRQWAQKGWLPAETTPGGHRRFLRRHIETFARERGLAFQPSDDGELRVLVVDDDARLCKFVVEALKRAQDPITTEVAYNGFEAGQKVLSFSPHVVLLDLMMPGLDGFTVCKQLKEDTVTKAIDIIAITGFYTVENAERIRNAGAKACLEKPLEVDTIIRAVGMARARATN